MRLKKTFVGLSEIGTGMAAVSLHDVLANSSHDTMGVVVGIGGLVLGIEGIIRTGEGLAEAPQPSSDHITT